MQTERCRQISDLEVQAVDYLKTPEYESRHKSGDFELIVFDRCAPSAMPFAEYTFHRCCTTQNRASSQRSKRQHRHLAKRESATRRERQDAALQDQGSAMEKPAEMVGGNVGSRKVSSESDLVDEWKMGEASGPVIILDVDRSHPITQYLEMNSVIIVEGMTVTPPEQGTVLMSSDSGPVFGLSARGPFQDAVLGFSVVVNENTDWGLRRSFPVFVYAAIETLGGGATESSADSIRPGDSIRVGLAPQVTECVVETPAKERISLTRGSDSRFLFTRTDDLGIYKIYDAGSNELLESFCVNLFSNRESDVRAITTIEMGAKAVAAESSTIRSRQETWRWLIIGGLALLILEWGIFNRRVFT